MSYVEAIRRFGLVSVVLVALSVAAPARAEMWCSEGDVERSAPRQDLALEVARLVNEHRASIGVGPLTVSPALMRSALWKSNHMAVLGYFDHNDPPPPVARSPFQRMTDCGFPPSSASAENIAYGTATAQAVMEQWLSSPGHRRNIEDPAYTQIGVGAAGPSRHWTQNFGRTGTAEPAIEPPLAAPDAIEMLEDASAVAPLTANDAGGPWLHVTTLDAVSELTITPTPDGRGVSVRPAHDFAGTLTLTQRIADVMGQQAETSFTVRVLPVNDTPVAGNDRRHVARTASRVTIPVLANDVDVDGDALRVSLAIAPRHGRARVDGNRIVYRPGRRWRGRDTLTYRITDPARASATALVRLRGPRRK